ncbi:MAG: lipopolysaccharide heptosyltransferase I [Acidobacteriota bacterium]|nr:lipopolysaccharide heptosyltransferase I [Acidobacteriota bacterium]
MVRCHLDGMQAILIVRLGAMGDIVHALPAVAALRAAYPRARIDWVADEKHRQLLELIPILDRVVLLKQTLSIRHRVTELRRTLRAMSYDVAVDLQGLIKSAVVAKLSGARRIVGFEWAHLRDRRAGWFYTDMHEPSGSSHVIHKNLALVGSLGIDVDVTTPQFPLAIPGSAVIDAWRASDPETSAAYVVLNPGAAWPNKRWPPERFGAVASWLWRERQLRSVVTWGPQDEALATSVVEAAPGAAVLAPPTGVADFIVLARRARLVVSGDTGPVHLAAAVGTPVTGIYGPTDAVRNGSWAHKDRVVSRYDQCRCHYRRRCHVAHWCLTDVSVGEVMRVIGQRLDGA